MGQKVHPGGMRVGVIHDWKSNWYTGKKEFPDYLIEDIKIRDHITGKLAHAGLSDILIRKDKQRITVDIYTARPGIVIGKSGVEVDALRRELHALTKKNVHINISEIMPEGYGGLDTDKDVRLGEQDQARRRRGGAQEGLGASRESGRDRQRDREGLGPVRPQRRRGGQGGRGGRPSPRDRAARQDNVERPRTDEQAVSAEGREQPELEPQVETTPAPVADAPDSTTPKTMHEDPTKREQSGDESADRPG